MVIFNATGNSMEQGAWGMEKRGRRKEKVHIFGTAGLHDRTTKNRPGKGAVFSVR